MKCPFRIGRKVYDGGEDCDPKCAWLMRDTDDIEFNACAIAVIAAMTGEQSDNSVNGWVACNEKRIGK